MGLFDSKPKKQLRNINGYIVDENGQLVDVPVGLKTYNIPAEVKILNPSPELSANKVLEKLREAEEIVFADGGIEKLPADYFTFGSKPKIKKIKLPNGLKELGDRAIDAVTVDYNFPTTIEYLGKDMYPNASKLVIPSGIKNLGSQFASHDTSLTHVEAPGSIKKLPYCFVNQCKNLKTLILHEGIEDADIKAFFGLNSLEYLELPDSFKAPFESVMENRGGSNKRGNSSYDGGRGVFEAQQNNIVTIKKTHNGVPFTFQIRRGDFREIAFIGTSAVIRSFDGKEINIDLSKLDSKSVYSVNIEEGKISQVSNQQPFQSQTPIKPTPQFQQPTSQPQPVQPSPRPTPQVNPQQQLPKPIQPINGQPQQSMPKPVPPTGGDPLYSGYTDAEITAMLQEILFEYVYRTDYYQNLDFKTKTQLHAPFNEEIRKKLRRLKKGQQLDIDAINYLFEELVRKLNAQKNNSEELLQEQARQEELERLKQARQQIPATEEAVEEEQGEGMFM